MYGAFKTSAKYYHVKEVYMAYDKRGYEYLDDIVDLYLGKNTATNIQHAELKKEILNGNPFLRARKDKNGKIIINNYETICVYYWKATTRSARIPIRKPAKNKDNTSS